MRLTDLHPEWIGAGGEGIYNADGTKATERHGVGILLDCPCGKCDEFHQLYVPFSNPLDGGPAVNDGHPIWNRVGETFETLTLTPSIQRMQDCRWHGFITDGAVLTC